MEQQKQVNKKKPWWILGVAGAFLLSKLKLVLSLLKLGTVGGTLISMLLSVGAYMFIFPMKMAIGFVLLILIHELGHVIAAKQKGLPTSAPVFIPFVGALINMKKHPRDATTEAYIAIGGPILGTIGALAIYAAGWLWSNPLLIYIAYIGFLLNLINLLPIHPLDGGRIVVAISRWLWLVGLTAGLAIIILYIQSIIFYIIWGMFAWDLYVKYVRNRSKSRVLTSWAAFEIPLEPLLEQGVFIPGAEHRRELSFETYSDLNGLQTVQIYWDQLALHGKVQLPQQGLIQKVQVIGIERLTKETGQYLVTRIQVDYVPFENDAYYNVAPSARWKFGIAYALLASFLGYMMYYSAILSRAL